MNDHLKVAPAPAPAQEARKLETEIENVRKRLDKSLSELDRRRHELTDVRLQLRKHPEVLMIAAGVAALVVGGIALSIYRSRRRRLPVQQAERVQMAMDRAVEHPERVARGRPSVGEKVLASVATTVAVALAKKMIDKAWTARQESAQGSPLH